MYAVLDNGRHVGNLVEEVELSLVKIFGWTRERTGDLLHHLFQQLSDVRCDHTHDNITVGYAFTRFP